MFLKSMEIFIKEIKKHNNQTDPYYIYATEKSKSEYEHYHILLFLNGKVTQNTHNYFDLFQKIWYKQIKVEQRFNNGLVQRSKLKTSDHNYNGTRIKRNSENFIHDLLYALNFSEYLLKDNQKEEVEFRKKINGSQLTYENQDDNPKIFAQKLIQFSQNHKEMDFAAFTFFDAKFNIPFSQNSQKIIKITNKKVIPSWVGDNSDNFKEDIFEELRLTEVELRCFSLNEKPNSDIQPSIIQLDKPIQKIDDLDDDFDMKIPFPQLYPDKKLKEENIAKFSQPTDINQTPFYIGSYLKDPEEDEE